MKRVTVRSYRIVDQVPEQARQRLLRCAPFAERTQWYTDEVRIKIGRAIRAGRNGPERSNQGEGYREPLLWTPRPSLGCDSHSQRGGSNWSSHRVAPAR